jgi:ribosomal protein S18 acetylase RimI-like enzyme
MIAQTFVFEDKIESRTNAYYSILMDSIDFYEFKQKQLDHMPESLKSTLKTSDEKEKNFKRKWQSFLKKLNIPHQKRSYKKIPALKIGRLAVNADCKRSGYGSLMMDHIKILALEASETTGCRFITVDAYNTTEALAYYEKNDFQYMRADEKNDTRYMIFDLKTLQGL